MLKNFRAISYIQVLFKRVIFSLQKGNSVYLGHCWKGPFPQWPNSHLGYQALPQEVNRPSQGDPLELKYMPNYLPFKIVTSLLSISRPLADKLHVIDFGGGNGEHYFEATALMRRLIEGVSFCWKIIELPHVVAHFENLYQSTELSYSRKIDQHIGPDLLLLSGSIQYVNSPFELLEDLLKLKPKQVIFDRLPNSNNNQDVVFLQRIFYSAKTVELPMWTLSLDKLVSFFVDRSYHLVYSWDCYDKSPTKKKCKGFLFRAS